MKHFAAKRSNLRLPRIASKCLGLSRKISLVCAGETIGQSVARSSWVIKCVGCGGKNYWQNTCKLLAKRRQTQATMAQTGIRVFFGGIPPRLTSYGGAFGEWAGFGQGRGPKGRAAEGGACLLDRPGTVSPMISAAG